MVKELVQFIKLPLHGLRYYVLFLVAVWSPMCCVRMQLSGRLFYLTLHAYFRCSLVRVCAFCLSGCLAALSY